MLNPQLMICRFFFDQMCLDGNFDEILQNFVQIFLKKNCTTYIGVLALFSTIPGIVLSEFLVWTDNDAVFRRLLT